MSQLFEAEHYDTLNQYQHDRFRDSFGLTLGELGLTLPKLVGAIGSFTLRKEDLEGYHFLHYGAPAGDIETLLNPVSNWRDVDLSESTSRLNEIGFSEMIGQEKLTKPLALGRICLGSEAGHMQPPPSLTQNVDALKVEGDETFIPSELQRRGTFLYPKPGVTLEFLDRISTELPELGADEAILHAKGTSEKLEQFSFNVDNILMRRLTRNDSLPHATFLAAKSITKNWVSYLLKIEKVADIPALY